VRATATAKGELTGLTIDPSIFVPSEKEIAEDLILAAIKDAQARAAQMTADEMARLTESFGIPPGMKLPF
jgi:DNA-binding protein YbaB